MSRVLLRFPEDDDCGGESLMEPRADSPRRERPSLGSWEEGTRRRWRGASVPTVTGARLMMSCRVMDLSRSRREPWECVEWVETMEVIDMVDESVPWKCSTGSVSLLSESVDANLEPGLEAVSPPVA